MSNNYLYYTALINNDGSSVPAYESEVEPPFEFKEDRKVALLEKPEEYEVCVQNSRISLKSLPVFISTIKYNNTNPSDTQKHQTIYEITLVYDGYSATTPVYFEPQDETLTLPNFVNGKANYKSGYYNLYNYEFFFTMVNAAIRTTFLKLIDVIKSYFGGTLPTDFSDLSTNGNFKISYFIFDKESSLIFLNSPKSTFSDSNSSHVNIMLNRALYRLFNSLPFKLQNKTFNTLDETTQITTTKTLFKLNLSNFKQANEVEIYPHLSNGSSGLIKKTHILIYQDYETLSTWSPIESILIVSPNFPIQSHAVSADLDYINGFPTVIGDVRYESEILEISTNSPGPSIIYEPKQYRFMHMKQTDSGLTNIIFKIYYRFKNDGSLIQVKANLGGSLSLKLMFRKIK